MVVIFQVLSIIFVMLTVGTGAGTIITGFIASRRQAKAIADATTNAATAQTNAATAQRDAAIAQGEVAELQTVVATAEKERAEAQLALIQLQERTKDRHLSNEEKARVVAVMRSVAGSTITITNSPGSPEAHTFATELKAALEEAGVRVPDIPVISIFGAPTGVVFEINDDESLRVANLLNAAVGSRFNIRILRRGGDPNGVLNILVALKP